MLYYSAPSSPPTSFTTPCSKALRIFHLASIDTSAPSHLPSSIGLPSLLHSRSLLSVYLFVIRQSPNRSPASSDPSNRTRVSLPIVPDLAYLAAVTPLPLLHISVTVLVTAPQDWQPAINSNHPKYSSSPVVAVGFDAPPRRRIK